MKKEDSMSLNTSLKEEVALNGGMLNPNTGEVPIEALKGL